jgi:chloramphenicol-sensitive protein RarD
MGSMTTDVIQKPDEADAAARRGFVLGFSAYFLWGLLPLYMKWVAHLPLMEVIAHRVVWSLPIAGLVLVWLGRTADFKTALRSPRMLGMATLTACIISFNWSIYIWAIATDRAIETALGYYINPLVTVMIGALLLGERLNRVQATAVGLAAVAVAILTYENGTLPWISLALAFSFAAYGYFRKTLPVGPSQGFLLEVMILSVPAGAYIAWLLATGGDHIVHGSWLDTVLLVGCGPITAVPLLMFAFGAKALRLSTIGLMQYIAPTMLFLIAVFVFNEPFGRAQLAAFALIWIALAIYTWSTLKGK